MGIKINKISNVYRDICRQ